MQSVSSRIWTRVTVFISCNDNHYTTGTSENQGYILILEPKLRDDNPANHLELFVI